MSNASNLAAIKQTYYLIDDNFDQIYSQCNTPDLKQQATELRDGARDTVALVYREMASAARKIRRSSH